MWQQYGGVILATLLLGLPLGVLAVALVSRRRIRGGWEPLWARRATLAEVAAAVGTLPWVWMILTPTAGTGGVQLVPLRDLLAVLRGDDTVVQVVGNLLAFAALGFFLPIRFRMGGAGWVPAMVALVAAGASILVETLQFFLPIGRVASVDDVLLNAAGATLATLLSARWWRARIGPPERLRPSRPSSGAGGPDGS